MPKLPCGHEWDYSLSSVRRCPECARISDVEIKQAFHRSAPETLTIEVTWPVRRVIRYAIPRGLRRRNTK